MKTKPIIIIAVTFLIVLAIGFFLIWPTALAVYNGWRDLSTSQENLKKVEARNQAIAEIKKNKDPLTNVSTIAEKYIPKSYESSQLVLELTAIAQDNGLTVNETTMETVKTKAASQEEDTTATPKSSASPTPGASSSPGSTPSTVQNINFSMKLTGPYPSFLNFLKTVETSSKLTVIKNLALQTDTAAGSDKLSFQISGTSFYKSKPTIENTVANLAVSKTTIDMFLNLKSFAAPINPAESGYGRGDPFAGY